MFGIKKLPLAIRLMSLPLAATTSLPLMAMETRTLEEVVVTAQKREQNLQDVPVAVSAFTGEQLQEAVVKDIFDLQTNTPGLSAGQNQTNTTSSFTIRGIGTSGQNFGLESSVGSYVDGVYRARPSSMINNLVDMEAVEVLRGPQGTLFGKNTPAGAIQFRTKAPSHETDGFIDVTAGNYGLINTSAAANLSLAEDVLAVRATLFSSRRDGTVDANIDGENEELNTRDRWGARFQALYTPNDEVSVRFIADQSEIDEICCAALTTQGSVTASNRTDAMGNPIFGPGAILAALGGTNFSGDQYDDYQTALNFAPISRGEDSGLSLEVNWDLSDTMTLTSITASRDYTSYDLIDSDFGNVDLISTTNDSEQSSFSQELRLAYSSERINAVAGAYYFDQEVDMDYTLTNNTMINPYLTTALGLTPLIDGINSITPYTGVTTANPYINGYSPRHSAAQQHESWAVFGQFDYSLTDDLTLTMGLRYTEEEKAMQTVFTEWVNDTPWTAGPPPNLDLVGGGLNAMKDGDFSALADPNFHAALPAFAVEGWGNYLFAANRPRTNIDTKLTDEQVTGTIKLSYALSDLTMMYASYGTGYKSGGTNTDRIDQAFNPVFGAENSDAFEVGLKTDFPDQALRLNMALHHTMLKDYQANAFTGTGFNLQNAGNLKSYGMEVEALWAPADNTTVTAAYAYNKATFDEFKAGNCWVSTPFHTGVTDPGKTDPTVNVCDRTGDPLAMTPEQFITVGVRQDFGLTDGIDGYVHGEYNYQSETMTSNVNDPLMNRDALGLLNLRAGLMFAGLDADLTLWGRNVLDERYQRVGFDAPIQDGTVMAYPGEPRTFGVSLNKRF